MSTIGGIIAQKFTLMAPTSDQMGIQHAVLGKRKAPQVEFFGRQTRFLLAVVIIIAVTVTIRDDLILASVARSA
jgi:hypothetical protein